MSTAINQTMLERYKGNFLKEVSENIEEGDWVKMCMQCGVCSGSCPFGPHWDHPPQELFMMIRANKRDEVLSSSSMWMCTSCYNCIVRCPRGLPITHIMHGLATHAKRTGLMPQYQPTADFGTKFWNNLAKTGRVNELKLGLALYFKDGFVPGVKTAMSKQKLGMDMMKTKRMNPMEILGGHGIQDKAGFQAMLQKAQELEMARLQEKQTQESA